VLKALIFLRGGLLRYTEKNSDGVFSSHVFTHIKIVDFLLNEFFFQLFLLNMTTAAPSRQLTQTALLTFNVYTVYGNRFVGYHDIFDEEV
jgi:hypothetical protein